MGLDQYLYASEYLSDGSWLTEEKRSAYGKIREVLGAESFENKEYPSISVKVKVGYWRKANQIHNWFVKEVQDGEDNCKEYYVSREKLEELLQLCKDVKASKHPDVVNDLLPPSAGFFFGSYEIDDWYWKQIDDTMEQLGQVLSQAPADWDFSYQSSW
jgi:hypothetical protein